MEKLLDKVTAYFFYACVPASLLMAWNTLMNTTDHITTAFGLLFVFIAAFCFVAGYVINKEANEL